MRAQTCSSQSAIAAPSDISPCQIYQQNCFSFWGEPRPVKIPLIGCINKIDSVFGASPGCECYNLEAKHELPE